MSKDSVSYRSVGDQVPMRTRLLKAASELFAKKGYHASSLMDIARHCGVRKSTVFHHFPSKEALALETVQLVQVYCESELANCLKSGLSKSPEQRAIDFIKFIQKTLQDRPEIFLVNFIALELVDKANSPFNQPIKTYFATWEQALLEILTSLQGKTRAPSLATWSLVYLQGMQMMAKINQDSAVFRQIPSYLLGLWGLSS